MLGLAPAAHGANRTGRIFTGDRSGDWLFAALHRTGFANQPTRVHRDDGLRLSDLWIGAAVRCAPPANKPTPEEREQLPALRPRGAGADRALVILCLGEFAWNAAMALLPGAPAPPAALRPRRRVPPASGRSLLGSFHPSQQNTFTGKLTEAMTDAVLLRARELAGLDPPSSPGSR